MLRFENAELGVVAQIVRHPDGSGVGESVLYAMDAFGLTVDGATHCVTERRSFSYTNTHHNWADRVRATIGGVQYDLAMEYTFPIGGAAGVWSVSLTGTRLGTVVLEKTALTRTGGPVGCYACPAPLPIYVSEIMPSNVASLADESGEFEPWLEIWNPSSDPVELSGWSLSNALDDRRLWSFPDVTVPRAGFVVVFADGETSDGQLHASFTLSSSGGEVVLTAPDGTTDGGFLYESTESDTSLIFDYEEGDYRESEAPTPGERNPNVPG